MLNTVIIDDDYVSRMVLRKMLGNHPGGCNILGEAESVEGGAKLIKDTDPDLVFLDVSLPDGTGFDLLDRFKEIEFKVIFVTAYSEYAVKAFKYPTFDYIVKPIDIDDLVRSINRIPDVHKNGNSHKEMILKDNLSADIEKVSPTVALPEMNGFAIIKVDDIIRCEGKRNYTRIILGEGKEKIVSRTLLEFEHLLAPLGFIRIHRSHLVNILNVVRYIKSEGGKVELRSGEQLKISSKHKEEVLNKILSNKL